MKKRTLYILLALATLACQRNEMQQEEPTGTPIKVPLELSFQPTTTTASKAEEQPFANHTEAISSQVLVDPIDQPQSRAVDETKVANLWVLQFDGTATTSRLIYKAYIATYIPGTPVAMIKSTAANRVAVVANTFDAAWGNSFVVGTATWATVSAVKKGVASQTDVVKSVDETAYVPMNGSYQGAVTIDQPIPVPLVRTVVKVTINIKSGTDLGVSTIRAQLCNVPNTTSWFPDTGTGVWPSSTTTITYAAQDTTGVTTTDYTTLTYWVPVNRRGNIAGKTALTRNVSPPTGATYVKVWTGAWIYTIHLGGDFLTDYNLKANTAYTYNLTLRPDASGTDSRIAMQQGIGALVCSPTTVPRTGGVVTITSPNAPAGLVWTAVSDYPDVVVLGAVSGSGPTSSVKATLGLNPTNQPRFVVTATIAGGASSQVAILQEASAWSVPNTGQISSFGGTGYVAIYGTAGLAYRVSKTSGNGAVALVTDPSTGTIPADGVALIPTKTLPAQASGAAARSAVFAAACTNTGTNFSSTNVTITQTGFVSEASLLIGQFGGTLVADGGVWQFTKPLYVSDADEVAAPWATEGTPGAATLLGLNSDNALFDGRGNTWTINKGHATLASTEHYPVANACFKKNTEWASFASAADARNVWYLPAKNQLMALWVVHNSLPVAARLGSSYHWSAMEVNASNAWVVHFGGGTTYHLFSKTTLSYKSRCVREGS